MSNANEWKKICVKNYIGILYRLYRYIAISNCITHVHRILNTISRFYQKFFIAF